MANLFSDIGWDVRWVGNESGFAGETSWATFTPVPAKGMNEAIPGNLDHEFNPFGTRGGKNWVPAECDVPLRPGWFYHPEQKGKTKNPEQLFSLYLKSVGRGAGLDLGIAPDSRGLLDDEDFKALEGFGKLVDESFKNNLAQASTLRVSNKRSKSYKGQFLIDRSIDSYWATDDTVKTAEVNLTWTADQTFDLIVSNPPYIPNLEKTQMQANVLDFEPHMALFVPDNDPLLFYRQISLIAHEALNSEAYLALEIHEKFALETKALLAGLGFKNVTIHRDLQGKERMILAQKA